jgi:hypothetical protein
MTTFALVRLVHVICAVLGGGLVAGVAVALGRSTEGPLLVRLTRWASVGLGATFLTGVALDFAIGGTLHERWWFRIAGLSMLVAGALLGVVRRRVTQVASGAADRATLRPAAWLAYAACGVVVWITVLMELQPF